MIYAVHKYSVLPPLSHLLGVYFTTLIEVRPGMALQITMAREMSGGHFQVEALVVSGWSDTLPFPQP